MLEIGGGLGVLSEHLAERAAHVHVVEIDERLREALLDATAPHANVEVHWADALQLPLAELRPAPTKVVANLPYGIAASALLRTVEELPSVTTWVAMVQREVGERLAAQPGTGAYGVPSVIAQLACEVRVLRAIPRTVFHPVPNVDSVLVGMTRRPGPDGLVLGGSEGAALRGLVGGAFAHRRKTLAGSLALAGRLPPGGRDEVREALGSAGPGRRRARRAALAAGVPLAGGNPRPVSAVAKLRALAPAKINLGLFVGPARDEDGRHVLASVMQSISLADELVLGPGEAGAEADEVVCPGVEGENLAARALVEFRSRTGWGAPPCRLEIHKRVPVAAGLGGGSGDAAATLRLARAASGLGDEALLLSIARELGADVPAQVSPGRWLAGGAGEQLTSLPPPSSSFGVLVQPASFALPTAEVYGEADRLGLVRDRAAVALAHADLGDAFSRGAPLPAARELLHNDLQRAAVSLRPELAETLRAVAAAGGAPALLSGSGPTVLGLFAGAGDQGLGLARLAATELREREPAPIAAVPVGAAFGEPQPVD